jgi:hypothetical protein
MDEMTKPGEMDETLRELAKQRDKLLGNVPALSPAREAVLKAFLAGKFPVEAALREAATRRDQLLNLHPPRVPAFAESILQRELHALRAKGLHPAPRKLDGLKPSSLSIQQLRDDGVRIADFGGRSSVWSTFCRSLPGIALTACAVIIALVLCFDGWGTPRSAALPNIPRVDPMNIELGTDLFIRKFSIGPFDLNTKERASLQAQASLLANREILFSDKIDAPLDLRLDLPGPAILVEDNLARIP